MQGVIKSYNPSTRDGTLVDDTTLSEYELAENALEGSVFRMLRPGQRVVFDVTSDNKAENIHLGSEQDMRTPSQLPD